MKREKKYVLLRCTCSRDGDDVWTMGVHRGNFVKCIPCGQSWGYAKDKERIKCEAHGVVEMVDLLQHAQMLGPLDTTQQKRMDNMHFYRRYAIKYDAPNGKYSGVAMGNWNTSRYSGKDDEPLADCERIMEIVSNLLDMMGVELVWDNEYKECASCNLPIRTTHDSYGWQPHFIRTRTLRRQRCDYGEDFIVCETCLAKWSKKDWYSYLCYQLPFAAHCFNYAGKHFPGCEALGFVKINGETLANGWYGGQCDNPKLIDAAFERAKVQRYFHMITNVGQFDTHWDTYVHTADWRRAKKAWQESLPVGPDPAVALRQALTAQTGAVKFYDRGIAFPAGETKIRVEHIGGACGTYCYVTQEEFIAGKTLEIAAECHRLRLAAEKEKAQ